MLAAAIRAQALAQPLKPALIHDGGVWTYAQFAQAIAAARAHLSAQQLPSQGVVVLAIRNLAESWVQGIALRSLGLTTISIPAAVGVAGLRMQTVAAVVVSAAEDAAATVVPAQARGWRVLTVPPARTEGSTILAETLPTQGGHILMTSGTTGDYKMILRDPADEMRQLPLSARINELDRDSVVFCADFPPLTAGGYRWPLLTWSLGGSVVFHQGGDLLNALLGSGATQAYATPGMLGLMLRAPDRGLPRRDGLRLLVTGGPLPLALAQAARARITRQVFTVLASTEMLNLTLTPAETAGDLVWHRVHPQREVQVVDESDRPLPAGQVGFLRARLIDGLRGYLDDPAATQRFFRDDWFYPGDLAAFHADGRLALHGRVTDVINVQGNKVATGPIEQELQDRLGAEGVCVFSAPDEQGEELVHVAIQPITPVTRSQIEVIGRELLKVYGRARFHIVESMPRNHMGKVQRLALRRQLLG